MRKVLRIVPHHLYLELDGGEEVALLDTTARLLLRDGSNDFVLIGGGWSDGKDYKVTGPPVFAPEYLRDRLLERGVPADRIVIAPRRSIRHWLLNVVSTWGETKQMHELLRELMRREKAGQANLAFVGLPSHMARAIHLWRWYNGLMRCLGRGVRMTIGKPVILLGVPIDEKWAKGEPMRNLIAYIDPFGIGPAFLIHLLRRFQARRACPGQHS